VIGGGYFYSQWRFPPSFWTIAYLRSSSPAIVPCCTILWAGDLGAYAIAELWLIHVPLVTSQAFVRLAALGDRRPSLDYAYLQLPLQAFPRTRAVRSCWGTVGDLGCDAYTRI